MVGIVYIVVFLPPYTNTQKIEKETETITGCRPAYKPEEMSIVRVPWLLRHVIAAGNQQLERKTNKKSVAKPRNLLHVIWKCFKLKYSCVQVLCSQPCQEATHISLWKKRGGLLQFGLEEYYRRQSQYWIERWFATSVCNKNAIRTEYGRKRGFKRLSRQRVASGARTQKAEIHRQLVRIIV